MATILIVDDDAGFRTLMDTILQGEGYETETAASVAEARAAGAHRSFHLVVTDLKLPDGSGLDVLRFWKQEMPEIPVVVITGFGTVSSAVEAMKLGAVDYLGNRSAARTNCGSLCARRWTRTRRCGNGLVLREQEEARFPCCDLIAGDPAMTRVVELMRQRRAHPGHGAAHRRERHRQGSDRPLHPPQQRRARTARSWR